MAAGHDPVIRMASLPSPLCLEQIEVEELIPATHVLHRNRNKQSRHGNLRLSTCHEETDGFKRVNHFMASASPLPTRDDEPLERQTHSRGRPSSSIKPGQNSSRPPSSKNRASSSRVTRRGKSATKHVTDLDSGLAPACGESQHQEPPEYRAMTSPNNQADGSQTVKSKQASKDKTLESDDCSVSDTEPVTLVKHRTNQLRGHSGKVHRATTDTPVSTITANTAKEDIVELHGRGSGTKIEGKGGCKLMSGKVPPPLKKRPSLAAVAATAAFANDLRKRVRTTSKHGASPRVRGRAEGYQMAAMPNNRRIR